MIRCWNACDVAATCNCGWRERNAYAHKRRPAQGEPPRRGRQARGSPGDKAGFSGQPYEQAGFIPRQPCCRHQQGRGASQCVAHGCHAPRGAYFGLAAPPRWRWCQRALGEGPSHRHPHARPVYRGASGHCGCRGRAFGLHHFVRQPHGSDQRHGHRGRDLGEPLRLDLRC